MVAMTSKRIRGEEIDAAATMEYWLDSPVWGNKRPSKDAYDFGDKETVGKQVKRSYLSLSFHELELGLDFGMFLGEHKGKWVIAIYNEEGNQLAKGEVFDSLSDLKQAWELD